MNEKIHEIDGVKYREVERKARIGEKVIIVNPQHTFAMNGYNVGDIFNVTAVYSQSAETYVPTPDKDDRLRFWDSEYRVLEPVTSPTDRDDIIANLARRVTELERYVYEVDAKPTPVATTEEIDRAVEAKRENDVFRDIENKSLKLSDLHGKTLRIYSATDSEGELEVTVTVGIDEKGVMYVIDNKAEVLV